jgi:peptidyl-tRNA hydrolase
VAAKLRRDLGIEVEMVHGAYGEYKVLVDGETVIDGGALTILGIVPTGRKVVDAVRTHLSG